MKIKLIFDKKITSEFRREKYTNNKPKSPSDDLVGMLIEEELLSDSIPRFKAYILNKGQYGNDQISIRRVSPNTFELSDQIDDSVTILLSQDQILNIFNAIEWSSNKIREMSKQSNAMPQIVTYTFDDDWNWKVDIKQ